MDSLGYVQVLSTGQVPVPVGRRVHVYCVLCILALSTCTAWLLPILIINLQINNRNVRVPIAVSLQHSILNEYRHLRFETRTTPGI